MAITAWAAKFGQLDLLVGEGGFLSVDAHGADQSSSFSIGTTSGGSADFAPDLGLIPNVGMRRCSFDEDREDFQVRKGRCL
jgi:hypothetical protein